MPSAAAAAGTWSARSLALARDALALSRVGTAEVAAHRAPYAVVGRGAEYRLRRYFPDVPPTGAPALLVAPLVLTGEVWDLTSDVSAVQRLADRGVDPWVVELAPPRDDHHDVPGMLGRRVQAVSAAIDDVIAVAGRSVHVVGYSQGGLLAYLAVAHRSSQGVASVVTLGAPIDPSEALGVPGEDTPASVVAEIAALLEVGVRIPGWAGRRFLRFVDPGRTTQRRVDFVVRLRDRDGRLPREGSRRLLQADRSFAFPGPALIAAGRAFAAQNAVLAGPLPVAGDPVGLDDLTVPVLAVDGAADAIAPAASVRPIARAAPGAQVWGHTVGTGHVGLVAGARADADVWPVVAEWIHWTDGEGIRPAVLRSLSAGPEDDPAAFGLGVGGQSLVEATVDAARLLATGTARTARRLRGLGEEAVEQLPRLSLLQQVRPGTRGSLALLLDEQADRDPERSQFLFDDRVHTRAEAKYRFDAVTYGMLSLGIRRGEHVGVLMRSRPSAIAATVALNRMGAVAVFLRPEGDTALEASLGRVDRIVCAPDLLDPARATGLPVAVLGSGGGRDRELPAGVIDMERIDETTVVPPAWYRPNPGQARDLAFILFTGDGSSLRVNRVTNGRWLLSALGTASAASLTVEDTVYCLTPPSHPSGLLVGLGGAIAGGSRLAMASSFDVDTFWAEVRRYGATVVTYTWTMLRELVDAPHHRGEERHPIRLFVGSGMTPDLWRRVLKRFAPARVVEFYSAADTHGVLVNLGGRNVGALGRPLPGGARMRVVRWDLDAHAPVLDDRGMAIAAVPGETGMLLAEADRALVVTGAVRALRGVFAPDDAWMVTGDLVRRDASGEFWMVDQARMLVPGKDGPRSPLEVRDTLEALSAVDGAAVHSERELTATGRVRRGRPPRLVAVVQLRSGQELTADDLDAAFAGRPSTGRPDVVRVVERLPVTSWYRPDTRALREDPPAFLAAWAWDGRRRAFVAQD